MNCFSAACTLAVYNYCIISFTWWLLRHDQNKEEKQFFLGRHVVSSMMWHIKMIAKEVLQVFSTSYSQNSTRVFKWQSCSWNISLTLGFRSFRYSFIHTYYICTYNTETENCSKYTLIVPFWIKNRFYNSQFITKRTIFSLFSCLKSKFNCLVMSRT